MLLLSLSVAHAESLAVLPLDRAAASEEFAGLGKGLAGMIVSDLDGLDAVELIERSRLDALVAELELGRSGIVDPETAQDFGEVLGAEWVLIGSYSVVAGTFAMDARVVDVETADVLYTAASQGPLDDWVAVEKDVVATLFAEVELSAKERRALMIETETESFDALTAWSEGLELEAEGRVDAARAAYAKALKLDPAFEQAQADLSELRAVIGSELDAREQARLDAADATTRLVLDTIPSTTDDAIDRLVRNDALSTAGLHCQRATELRQYLDSVDWELPVDQRARAPAHFANLRRVEITGEEYARVGAPTYWSTKDLLVDTPQHWRDDVAFHLGDAIVACGEEVPAELASLRRELQERGLADSQAHHDRTGLTADDKLAVLQGFALAQLGASSQLTGVLDDLLDRHEGDEVPRMRLESLVADILRVVEETERNHRARVGQTPGELMRIERAILEGDRSVFKVDNPACAYLETHEKPRAASWFPRYESAKAEYGDKGTWSIVNELGMVYGPARDLGCLEEPAVVGDPYEAAAFLKEAAKVNLRPEEGYCASKIVEAQGWKVDDDLVQNAGEAYVGFATWAPMMTYYNLVLWGCVEPLR